jgi:hypothetical protein
MLSEPSDDWPDEETDNPLRADDRNFYKLEKWTKDGSKIERLLYAGNNLDKARKLFGSNQTPAADQADDLAADARAGAVAKGMTLPVIGVVRSRRVITKETQAAATTLRANKNARSRV